MRLDRSPPTARWHSPSPTRALDRDYEAETYAAFLRLWSTEGPRRSVVWFADRLGVAPETAARWIAATPAPDPHDALTARIRHERAP